MREGGREGGREGMREGMRGGRERGEGGTPYTQQHYNEVHVLFHIQVALHKNPHMHIF